MKFFSTPLILAVTGALALAAGFAAPAQAATPPSPLATGDLVFAERGGLVAVEAEHFFQQELTEERAWQVFTPNQRPKLLPDTDGTHVTGASGGAYLEALPDSRWTHDEKLVHGENFSNVPGKMAVLSYKVHFSTPGRYYFWARIFSTGGEDNGMHVGLNGTWPESGQRWQTIKKNAWQWDSRQRTEQVHVGVPGQLFLDVPSAGEHIVQISMREDGFEIDKWLMTTDRNYTPEGTGPAAVVKSGRAPSPFTIPTGYIDAPAPTPFTPKQVAEKAAKKAAAPTKAPANAPAAVASKATAVRPAPQTQANVTVSAAALKLEGSGFYLDQGKWAAINPNQHKEAAVKFESPAANGNYRVTLHVVGENDGNASYEVLLGGRSLGSFTAAPSKEMFEEGPAFTHTWTDVRANEGERVEVRARIASNDGQEYSRARWSKLVFAVAQVDPGREASRLDLAAAQKAAVRRPVARQPHGNGAVRVSGELKQWHKVTVDLAGPFAAETDTSPNPFTGYRFDVTFTHESGTPSYRVPGYFAADGNAAETSATAGTVWRAHLAPDKSGKWNYRVTFAQGPHAATEGTGAALAPFDGKSGTFTVAATDKSGRDFRAKGRLVQRGRYLHHAGTGDVFLKAGADAPETLLGYSDFDDTIALKKNVPLKTWAPHLRDWRPGDPTWKDGKGKGLIGALNYLSAKGANAFSFLTYNAAGDGDNVWPFIARDDKFHYDCSKLDQWGIVFDHGTRLGLYLHFKLQENESDDQRLGAQRREASVPEALDGGALGPERKLYCRELIARFGHNLALNWNIGEENTQSTEEIKAMVAYLRATDPYQHLVVLHTFPNQQDEVYGPLLGSRSELTGLSIQNSNVKDTHWQVIKWIKQSTEAGKPWVVAFDEPGNATFGMPPDDSWPGMKELRASDQGPKIPTVDQIRQQVLWGALLAGGGGVEYYFGYRLPENDLVCEDWRSRDQSWDYCRIALEFFAREKIPVARMANANALVGNPEHDNSRYCFAQSGELYLVYLPTGGKTDLDLAAARGAFSVAWFNPRIGGALTPSSDVAGGRSVSLQAPSSDDWLAVVRRK